jgi:hypothetical protein
MGYVLGIIMAIITLIVAIILGFFVLIEKKRTKKTTTSTSTPTAKTPKNWDKILGLVVFLVVTGIVLFLWYKHIEVKERLVAEIRTTKVTTPKEEWFFSWRLPPGHYIGGRNSHILSLEITRNDANSLHAIMHDNGGERLAGLRLKKKGQDLIGAWSNYRSDDGGDCYLYYQAPDVWSGHHTLKGGKKIDCSITIKRK